MTEIPKEALEKAAELASTDLGNRAFARYIADVSEKAKEIDFLLGIRNFHETGEVRTLVQSFILPNPEDDLLKEAREIVAQHFRDKGYCGLANTVLSRGGDDWDATCCTLAALRKGN